MNFFYKNRSKIRNVSFITQNLEKKIDKFHMDFKKLTDSFVINKK